jgi:hypothetical protein
MFSARSSILYGVELRLAESVESIFGSAIADNLLKTGDVFFLFFLLVAV